MEKRRKCRACVLSTVSKPLAQTDWTISKGRENKPSNRLKAVQTFGLGIGVQRDAMYRLSTWTTLNIMNWERPRFIPAVPAAV